MNRFFQIFSYIFLLVVSILHPIFSMNLSTNSSPNPASSLTQPTPQCSLWDINTWQARDFILLSNVADFIGGAAAVSSMCVVANSIANPWVSVPVGLVFGMTMCLPCRITSEWAGERVEIRTRDVVNSVAMERN